MINIINPSYAWFWDRKDKALDAELQGKGYAGTLPSLNLDLKPSEKKVVTPIFEVKKDFSDPKDLKPVPKNNPAFIDIITKKDKSSPYLTDIDEIIPIIEKLVSVIEEDESNLQLFITRANVLTMNIDYLIVKYEGKQESYFESFKKLAEVNRYVKTVSLLKKEAVDYQRYLAYQTSGSIYNPENISQQTQ